MRVGLVLALFLALPLAGCHGKPAKTNPGGQELRVSDAWVRLAVTAASPSAAYFTIHGGNADDRLTGVTSPQAARAEMHETMSGMHGMATMAPLKQLSVPAGGTIAFAPAGRHAMLFGLGPAVTPGGEIRLDFTFASGRTLSAQARVRAMGDDGQ